jgi:hypothetical protein
MVVATSAATAGFVIDGSISVLKRDHDTAEWLRADELGPSPNLRRVAAIAPGRAMVFEVSKFRPLKRSRDTASLATPIAMGSHTTSGAGDTRSFLFVAERIRRRTLNRLALGERPIASYSWS